MKLCVHSSISLSSNPQSKASFALCDGNHWRDARTTRWTLFLTISPSTFVFSIWHQCHKALLEETPNPNHVRVVVTNTYVVTLVVQGANCHRPWANWRINNVCDLEVAARCHVQGYWFPLAPEKYGLLNQHLSGHDLVRKRKSPRVPKPAALSSTVKRGISSSVLFWTTV